MQLSWVLRVAVSSRKPLGRVLGVAVSSLLAVSCGLFGGGAAGGAKVAASSATTTEPIKVIFETDARSNGCAALHVLVREVKRTDYPRVEYEDAARWLRDGSDDKTLEWLVLMPGEECEREIRRPAGRDVAVFFMFASPSEKWKWLITSEKKDMIRLAVVDKRACTTAVNTEPSGSRDAPVSSGHARKRCRAYAE
jgi:hypothetical protein